MSDNNHDVYRSLDAAAIQWLFHRSVDQDRLEELLRHAGPQDGDVCPTPQPLLQQLQALARMVLRQNALAPPPDLEQEPGLAPVMPQLTEGVNGSGSVLRLPTGLVRFIDRDDDVYEIEEESRVTYEDRKTIHTKRTRVGFFPDTLDDDLPESMEEETETVYDGKDAKNGEVVSKRELIKVRRKEKKQQQRAEKLKEQNRQLLKQQEKNEAERAAFHEEISKLRRQLDIEQGRSRRFQQQAERVTQLEEEIKRLEQESTNRQETIEQLSAEGAHVDVLQKRLHLLQQENISLRTSLINGLDDIIGERIGLLRRLDETKADVTAALNRVRTERDLYIESSAQAHRTDSPRVGIFVDVQNMFYAARKRHNGKLNYQDLIDYTVRDRLMAKAVSYIIQTPDVDQSSFIAFMERCGYKVKSKELKTRLDGSAKGDWDMEIAMDIISSIDQLDVVVLVSGDGDFVPLVKMLKKHGLKVEVASFEYNTAMELRDIADTFLPIGEGLILDH